MRNRLLGNWKQVMAPRAIRYEANSPAPFVKGGWGDFGTDLKNYSPDTQTHKHPNTPTPPVRRTL